MFNEDISVSHRSSINHIKWQDSKETKTRVEAHVLWKVLHKKKRSQKNLKGQMLSVWGINTNNLHTILKGCGCICLQPWYIFPFITKRFAEKKVESPCVEISFLYCTKTRRPATGVLGFELWWDRGGGLSTELSILSAVEMDSERRVIGLTRRWSLTALLFHLTRVLQPEGQSENQQLSIGITWSQWPQPDPRKTSGNLCNHVRLAGWAYLITGGLLSYSLMYCLLTWCVVLGSGPEVSCIESTE